MALPISVTYTFATATSAIPLSQLDSNFTTVVNGVNGIGNGTNALSNVQITGGTITGLSSAIPVASGGTGLANLTLNNVILGNNTNSVKVVAPGTSGNVLTSDGTTWISQAPTGGGSGVSTISFGTTGLTPSTASNGTVTVAGTLVVGNGGTGLANLALNNVILGNNTGSVQVVAPGTSGNVLTSNGTTWLSQAATSGAINVQTFTSSGTWTKPAGYAAGSRVLIEIWGGGGSGGRGTSTTLGGGAGAGGGYSQMWKVLSDLGATETATVGAGGVGVSVNGVGNTGGTSSFGSYVYAYGGGKGNTGTNSGGGGQLGAGGDGFPGSPWNTGGCFTQIGLGPGFFVGGGGATPVGGTNINGITGYDAYLGGAGGGSSTTGTGATSGNGGTSYGGGNGGKGATSSVAAVSGSVPGGGGGGAYYNVGTSGAGGAGKIIITVFPA